MNAKNPPNEEPEEIPAVVDKVDTQQLRQFVTTIKSAEQQVGENIITALRNDNTVAVLTTVVLGPDGQQRVVSAAIDPELMPDVQQLLVRAQQEREAEEPCFGFHCFVQPKSQPDISAKEPSGNN